MKYRSWASVLLAAPLLTVAHAGQAQEFGQGMPPEADSAAHEPGTGLEGSKDEFRQVSVELNPLSLFIGRYSANVEYLPAVHHAIVVNPHYDSVTVDATLTDPLTNESQKFSDSFSGFGAELGYRYYTGRSGPNGFFVGPSFLIGRYNADASGFTGSSQKSFTNVGWAVDIGGQAVIGPGIVLGGGFGIQQTTNSLDEDAFGDLPLTAEILVGSGLRPRFLFSAGYAFD